MGAASFFASRGLTTVAGRTYPGTYSIATVSNFRLFVHDCGYSFAA